MRCSWKEEPAVGKTQAGKRKKPPPFGGSCQSEVKKRPTIHKKRGNHHRKHGFATTEGRGKRCRRYMQLGKHQAATKSSVGSGSGGRNRKGERNASVSPIEGRGVDRPMEAN